MDDNPIGELRLSDKEGAPAVPVFNQKPRGKVKGEYVLLDNPIEEGTSQAMRGGRLFDERGRHSQELSVKFVRQDGVSCLTVIVR